MGEDTKLFMNNNGTNTKIFLFFFKLNLWNCFKPPVSLSLFFFSLSLSLLILITPRFTAPRKKNNGNNNKLTRGTKLYFNLRITTETINNIITLKNNTVRRG